MSVRRPDLVPSLSLGACWLNPQRGFEEREPSVFGILAFCSLFDFGRSLSTMLTFSLKLAPAFALAVSGHVETAGASFARLFTSLSDWVRQEGSYLVDPASSHMLVSKIKPCMSKYKLLYTVKLRMAH